MTIFGSVSSLQSLRESMSHMSTKRDSLRPPGETTEWSRQAVNYRRVAALFHLPPGVTE